MKIKNQLYRQMIDYGIIEYVTAEHLQHALANIDKQGHDVQEGRALLICLYYTGARPVEALKMKGKDVILGDKQISVRIPGAKKGVPRTLDFPTRLKYLTELKQWAYISHPEAWLFYHYRNNYERLVFNKQGKSKIRLDITDKLRYYIKKWFKDVIDINPYYLRHNRMSMLSEDGFSDRELRQWKGTRRDDSIEYYIHASKQGRLRMKRKIKR